MMHSPLQWLFDFMAQGGPVLYGILLVCILLWALILERLWFFYIELPRANQRLASQWQQRDEHGSWTARKIRIAMLSQQRQAADTFLSTVGILIAICPLLGLLGTVTGMVSVFDVLAITGTGNAGRWPTVSPRQRFQPWPVWWCHSPDCISVPVLNA